MRFSACPSSVEFSFPSIAEMSRDAKQTRQTSLAVRAEFGQQHSEISQIDLHVTIDVAVRPR